MTARAGRNVPGARRPASAVSATPRPWHRGHGARSWPPRAAGHARPGSGCRANQPSGRCWLSWPRTYLQAHVLELGTGAGAGTAWIVSGLLPRTDVTVTTVEKDPQTAALAARGDWPQFVDLRVGDALGVLGESGTFDLIFADAQGGKWEGLDRTIAALGERGLLVVDDMNATPEWTAEQHTNQSRVWQTLLTSREHNKLSTGQAHAVLAATLLRQLQTVITTGQRWHPVIAAGGTTSPARTAA